MTSRNINNSHQTASCTLEAVDLREAALNWLANADALRKVAGVKGLNAAWLGGQVAVDHAGHGIGDFLEFQAQPAAA